MYRLEQTHRNLHKGAILSINLKLDSLSYRAGSTLGGSWRFDFLDIQIELLSAWGNYKVLAVTNKKPTRPTVVSFKLNIASSVWHDLAEYKLVLSIW